jgi:N6-adenosine-specific RNA methylase IME4
MLTQPLRGSITLEPSFMPSHKPHSGNHCAPTPKGERSNGYLGEVVSDLNELVQAGRRFATIYADPPWPYENEASRAAAVRHYPVMSLDALRNEPVEQLAEPNAHLHLWTTNAFLREALDLIEAWGFRYRSTFVWVKNRLGMGNYWRVSHEFLLLGVRGRLRFADQTQPSWLLAKRGRHSRKPDRVRQLIELVSPPPYLELFGREEIPHSSWTVFGNQVERRLF